MGDRGNVVFLFDSTAPVYLYTHWSGSELPELVQEVLRREQRWDDAPYLARMVFSAMVKDSIDGETGYGIATYPCDNEHPYIVINPAKETIGFAPPVDTAKLRPEKPPKPYKTWSFKQYGVLASEDINKFFQGPESVE